MVEVKKEGSLAVSNPYLILHATDNHILIRNVYQSPKTDSFNAYLIDYKSKRNISVSIRLKRIIPTALQLLKKHIQPNVFLFTDGYLGIPVYVSQHQGPFIHGTHPPPALLHLE